MDNYLLMFEISDHSLNGCYFVVAVTQTQEAMELVLEVAEETQCVQLKMECDEVAIDQNVQTCHTHLAETVIPGTLNTTDASAVTVKTEPSVDIKMGCDERLTLANTTQLITIFKTEAITPSVFSMTN